MTDGTSDLNNSQEARQAECDQANALKEADASFKATFKSLDSLLSAKLQKFASLKALVNAEASLSLSAILLIVLGVIALFGVILTLWLLITLAFGILLYQNTNSYFIAISCLFALNVTSAILLYKYIKRLRSLIGIPQTIESLQKE